MTRVSVHGEYLGETDVTEEHKNDRDATGWAMYFIENYGQIDGDHHKAWVLDQAARCLKGTPVTIKEARWEDGHSELRVSTGEPSEEYLKWKQEMRGEKDHCGDYEYWYEEGIPP